MISNHDNMIWSQDIIKAIDDGDEPNHSALVDLATQCEDFDDWNYGLSLIHDSYFKSYAMDLAEELGVIPTEYQWPTSCIDWDQAAYELRMDYTPVEFDGQTYWVR